MVVLFCFFVLGSPIQRGFAQRGVQGETPGAPVDIDLGGKVILRIRTGRHGLTCQQRADLITDRLVRVLAVPDLTPADVVVFSAPSCDPVIYVLGRKLVVVDHAAALAVGGGSALDLAVEWARSLQQILPLVDVRRRDEHEPTVPPDPPLLVTADLNAVGGSVGEVDFRDQAVMHLLGVQPDGLTAAEEADLVADRLTRAIYAAGPIGLNAIRVSEFANDPPVYGGMHPSPLVGEVAVDPYSMPRLGASATLFVGNVEIVSINPAEALAAGADSPASLADAWASNIRTVLSPKAP